jgi:curved DNA-binding protein
VGSRVGVAGDGEPAGQGGSAGDLFLVVRILPHPRFEARGQDLHTKVRIPVTTAVLGGELSVETLNGSSLRLKVPELSGSGRVFRLRGHGMPRAGKPDERGDMFVTAEIALPSELSPEQREHYEALRKL